MKSYFKLTPALATDMTKEGAEKHKFSMHRDIWTTLHGGLAWECNPKKIDKILCEPNSNPNTNPLISLLQQLDIEWSRRAELFLLPQYKNHITVLENKRMEYKFDNNSTLFKVFQAVSADILRSHKNAGTDPDFIHLIEPVDNLSVLSVFRMEKGSFVPMHEDRGILTFIYSPTDRNIEDSDNGSRSSLRIMAGSTLSLCSNKVIEPLSHEFPVVTTKYRYSFVFRLRGCSNAQVHKTGNNLSVGEYLSEFQTIRTSVNKPESIEVAKEGFFVNSSGSARVNNQQATSSSDKSNNRSTINFIRNLISKRDREISDLEEMHQDGSLTNDEVATLCNRTREEFQDAKRQRISEVNVEEASAPSTTLTTPIQSGKGKEGSLIKEETEVVATLSPSPVLNENTANIASVITLTIAVKLENGELVTLKIKQDTRMEKIFLAIARRLHVERSKLRFIFEGIKLNGDESPYTLEMQDDDVIYCMMEMCGD